MKNIALVYPGQGSQFVGMGLEIYQNFAEARYVMEEIENTLNQKLSALMFDGPMNELTMTQNAQPALLAVSMMIHRVLEKKLNTEKRIAKCLAGHSLGEYSALCAGGVINLSDAALLVKIRGNAMQQAVPAGIGQMAAIMGLPMEAVEEQTKLYFAKENLCVVANDNSPEQVVISGHNNAVKEVAELCTKAGAKKVVFLPVSAPFHSPLMESAAIIVEQAIEAITLQKNTTPVFSNVTAQDFGAIDKIPDLLVKQLVSRVRWRELVMNTKCDTIIEIGSGKVLTGLCKRINHEIQALTCKGTPKEIDDALAILSA